MRYIHRTSVGPTDYRCHSNQWFSPGVLPSSCPPLSQPAFASELLTSLGIWWYTVGSHTSPAIKQSPCKRKVAVSEGPSVLLNSLLVLWGTPRCSLKNLPTDTTGVFPSQGTCCNLTDFLDNTAFDPLRSNPEGHCAVEVTTLPWKPQKSLATSAFLFFTLRSGVPAQPFLAFLCLTACGISRKYSKVVLTCSFKGTNSCMFSVVLCILTCAFEVEAILSIYWFASFTGTTVITELLMLFSITINRELNNTNKIFGFYLLFLCCILSVCCIWQKQREAGI